MRYRFKALFVALAFALPQSAAAQDADGRPIVPVEKTPFHVPAFHNEYVTLLNVLIPAGRTALYHKHSTDMITVIVEDVDAFSQALGQQANPVRRTPRGNVNFNGFSKQPLVHKVTNVGATPYHIIGFELMYPEPGRFTASSRTDVPAYTLVIDNERIRGWRLVIEPGQSVAAITQTAPGIRIVVDGGELIEGVLGQPDRDMSLRVGDFTWQEAGITRAVRNAGTSQIQIIEFELK